MPEETEVIMTDSELFLSGILSQTEVLTNRFELLLLLFIFQSIIMVYFMVRSLSNGRRK